MAFLRDMTDRIWNYVSPRKTQQRRDKPFKAPVVPIKTRTTVKHVPAITPQSKVARWQVKTPSSAGSPDESMFPPSPPTSSLRDIGLDDDTLIQESVEETKTSSEEEWDANEETLVVDDGKYMEEQKTINREKERARREVQARELRQSGWSEDAVFLFQKLGMRGFEPLMPEDWINDFDSLPVDLFTANENKAYIKSDSCCNFRAQLALTDLLALGGFARDAVLTDAPIRTPEYHIRKAVTQYHRWAMKDCNMQRTWKDLSLFETVTCSKETPPYVAEQRMIRKLGKLMDRWRDAIQTNFETADSDIVAAPEELPTLYGVIASHTVMAFVSYVTPSEPNGRASVRMIAMFDFGEEGYDVWNALAIAIFVIHCRNRMKQLKEFLPKPVVTHSCDPDL